MVPLKEVSDQRPVEPSPRNWSDLIKPISLGSVPVTFVEPKLIFWSMDIFPTSVGSVPLIDEKSRYNI